MSDRYNFLPHTKPRKNTTFTQFSLLMNLWGLPFKTIWILSCLGTVLGAVLYALAGLYLATVDGYNETISYCWIPTNNHVPLAIERVIVTLVFKFGSRKTREASEKLRCCLRFLIRLGWLVKPNPRARFWHGPVCQTHYRARPYKSGSVYRKSSKIGTWRAMSWCWNVDILIPTFSFPDSKLVRAFIWSFVKDEI